MDYNAWRILSIFVYSMNQVFYILWWLAVSIAMLMILLHNMPHLLTQFILTRHSSSISQSQSMDMSTLFHLEILCNTLEYAFPCMNNSSHCFHWVAYVYCISHLRMKSRIQSGFKYRSIWTLASVVCLHIRMWRQITSPSMWFHIVPTTSLFFSSWQLPQWFPGTRYQLPGVKGTHTSQSSPRCTFTLQVPLYTLTQQAPSCKNLCAHTTSRTHKYTVS